MKRFLLIAILLLVLLVPAISMARTDVFLNFGIGIPAPIFITPVIVAPAPVFVVSPPVVVQPAPVIIGPRGRYVGKHRGWYKHHRHIKFEEDD